MTEPKKKKAKVNQHIDLHMTAEEYAKIDAQASARDLTNTLFLRMLIAGALTRGGRMVDTLLDSGKGIEKSSRIMRRHQPIGPKVLWPVAEARVWGRRIWKEDPRWELRCPRKHGQARGFDRDDQANWWYIYDTTTGAHTPVAWEAEEARRKGVEMMRNGLPE